MVSDAPSGSRAKGAVLRERVLGAAEARIARDGVQTLRARDVMADAGAALGSLYNAFADLDDVVVHVNSRTLAQLATALDSAVAATVDRGATPDAALLALALAYLRFAQDHRLLWSALFEHRFAPGRSVPDWHLAEQEALLVRLAAVLGRLRPDMGAQALRIRARTLFGALNGIVSASLAARFVGVSDGEIAAEVEAFVAILLAGMRPAPPVPSAD